MILAVFRKYALGPLEVLLWIWAGWKILAVGQEAFMIVLLLLAALTTRFVRVGWWGGFKLMFRSLRWSGRSLGGIVWNKTFGRISDKWKVWERKRADAPHGGEVVIRYAVTATAELRIIVGFLMNVVFVVVLTMALSSLGM